jgi:hypothetical protein
MNYWKQLNHVLKYFAVEENPDVRLPSNFMEGFLEASHTVLDIDICLTNKCAGTKLISDTLLQLNSLSIICNSSRLPCIVTQYLS